VTARSTQKIHRSLALIGIIIKKGLSNKLAGQVGEYLVCDKLGRRGLIATYFTGNMPEFDLIVADSSLKHFLLR